METELKLSLTEPDLPRLLNHPMLAITGNTQRLLNTYFDTPDLALQQRRMAVVSNWPKTRHASLATIWRVCCDTNAPTHASALFFEILKPL